MFRDKIKSFSRGQIIDSLPNYVAAEMVNHHYAEYVEQDIPVYEEKMLEEKVENKMLSPKKKTKEKQKDDDKE
jgi:hypothetical protein